jgi:pimeloyl-ACP methyl ester carboxylesterase
VVLVHGSEVDHAFFKPWVAPLTREAQLVYVDLVGHGRSEAGDPDDWNPEAWADPLVAFCASLGIEHPVVLGSSMGGRVAMHLALRAPALVRALMLVNTVGRPRPDRRVEMFRRLGGDEAAQAAERDIQNPTNDTRQAYVRLCMPHLIQRPYTAEELSRLTPPAPGVFDRLVELARSSTDLLPHVSAIACPTLVVTGEFDPAATPEDALDLAAAVGANAETPIVSRAGHGAYRDNRVPPSDWPLARGLRPSPELTPSPIERRRA